MGRFWQCVTITKWEEIACEGSSKGTAQGMSTQTFVHWGMRQEIARDVLTASSRHPYPDPIQHHQDQVNKQT